MPTITAMKLKIRKELPDLAEKLNTHGFKSRVVRNATIIELNPAEYQAGRQVYSLPDKSIIGEYSDMVLTIDTVESGGGASNTGRCHIACGISGKPLVPYLVPGTGHLSNGVHAHFCVFDKFVSIDCRYDRYGTEVEIYSVISKFDDSRRFVFLDIEKIWAGHPEELPVFLGKFQNAIEAATKKVQVYHCRSAHYVADKNIK